MADEDTDQILSQRDRRNVREEHVVERVGAARENSQTDHAKHDLICAHLIHLFLYRFQVRNHAVTLCDQFGQKDAREVEVNRHADQVDEVRVPARFKDSWHAGTTEEAEHPRHRDEPELAVHEAAQEQQVNISLIRRYERLHDLCDGLRSLERGGHRHLGKRALWQLAQQVVG